MKVCIVGASGMLGQYMVQHALDRGCEVVRVCREQSVGKLDGYKGRITVVPGAKNDPEVIKRAVAGCAGAVVEEFEGARENLSRIAELTDRQLDTVPPKDSFRYCDGQRTLEQVLTALLKHQDHQVRALQVALSPIQWSATALAGHDWRPDPAPGPLGRRYSRMRMR